MSNKKHTHSNLQRGSVDHTAAVQDITVIETRCTVFFCPPKILLPHTGLEFEPLRTNPCPVHHQYWSKIKQSFIRIIETDRFWFKFRKMATVICCILRTRWPTTSFCRSLNTLPGAQLLPDYFKSNNYTKRPSLQYFRWRHDGLNPNSSSVSALKCIPIKQKAVLESHLQFRGATGLLHLKQFNLISFLLVENCCLKHAEVKATFSTHREAVKTLAQGKSSLTSGSEPPPFFYLG